MYNKSMLNFVNADDQGDHRWWRVIGAIVFMLVPALLLATVGQFLVLKPFIDRFGGDETVAGTLAIAVYLAALFGAAIAGLMVGIRKLHLRSARSVLGTQGRFPIGDLLFGFIVYAALMMLVAGISDPASITSVITQKGPLMLALTALPLMCAFLVQGSGEEIIMRGYLPQVLQRLFGNVALSFLIPALVFALLHLGYGWVQFLSSLVFALFAIAVVATRGNLAAICGAHAANNFTILWLLSDLQSATAESQVLDLQEMLNEFAVLGGFLLALHLKDRVKRTLKRDESHWNAEPQ